MSGTILVGKGKSVDIRTIDFRRIVESLRAMGASVPVVRKALESVDEFGVNMICVDELNSEELRDFHRVLKSVQAELDEGLAAFVGTVIRFIELDGRFVS